ncbi:hypothetical protein [Nannocystis sp. SCPEA4]|uniref:hypothetical protein n=1 Tax=Nannocystis sp. SCPEA4 TaxID=2996787 RepID=UPI00226ED8E3|nr:hypothetical protein [Nannocystis sp. SCPEA4]MCY1060570.1 hypothetical protein [Nannocystis sp. SCPEA4]
MMVDAALAYARGGYEVILDGVLGPWWLSKFVDAAREAGLPLAYVVLRPPLAAGEGRALEHAAAITGLHREFTQLGPLESHALDTGTWSIDETVVASLSWLPPSGSRPASTTTLSSASPPTSSAPSRSPNKPRRCRPGAVKPSRRGSARAETIARGSRLVGQDVAQASGC